MTGDRVIRFVTALAVLAVAVIAAIVSFNHIEHLALTNGQPLLAARLLPGSVDGAVLAASLVLLDAARRGVPAPNLARVMLVLGVVATLGANAAIGAAHGAVGVLVSAWPAVAFLGSAEVFLGMARVRSQTVPEAASATAPESAPEPALADVSESAPAARPRAARALSPGTARRRGVPPAPEQIFAAELTAGTLPSIRAVKRQCRVGQVRALEIRNSLAAALAEAGSQLPVPEPA